MSAPATTPKGKPPATISRVSNDMLLEDEGIGQENVKTADLSLPYLSLLQQLSPQVNNRKAEYVDGAQPGMIFNNVTNRIYDGEKGILAIPVYYSRNHNEWVTREAGGGFVKDHKDDQAILANLTRDAAGRDILPNGNQLVITGTRYVFLVDEDTGAFERAVLTMSSTQMKKSNRWNTLVQMLRVPRPDGQGDFNPASFYMSYRLTTVVEEKDRNSWFGWKIEQYKPTLQLQNGETIYLEARRFLKAIRDGEVVVRPPQPGASGDGIADEEIPF